MSPNLPPVDGERMRRRIADLVRVPSITGDEAAAVDRVAGWLGALDGVEVDRWTASMAALEVDPECPGREVEREDVPVVAARVRGRRPGPSVMLTGHLDVVPTGDRRQWDEEPFSPKRRLVGGEPIDVLDRPQSGENRFRIVPAGIAKMLSVERHGMREILAGKTCGTLDPKA